MLIFWGGSKMLIPGLEMSLIQSKILEIISD